ncbi:hypothetical protein F4677DRAFT_253917 [Hypoxylon crocopeplum]|nr:hypothetical protein F4677DRAFT_253917 [Hypoxylon crocopeplum]
MQCGMNMLTSSDPQLRTTKKHQDRLRNMASGDPSGKAAKKSKKSAKDKKKDSKKGSSKSSNKDQSSGQNKEGSSEQTQGGSAGAYVSPPDFFSFNDPGDDFSAN